MSLAHRVISGRQAGPATADVMLLDSKLEPPPLCSATLARPRLLSAMSHGVARTPVTLICGPAGSGKTVLATSWLRAQQDHRDIAWISLDESDDEPATFWAYVGEALSAAGVELADIARPQAGEPLPDSFVTVLASRILASPQPVVLVLDNSDFLTDQVLCRSLDLFVRHAGSRLRLIVCGRADPRLPLHQYRLGDALTEIRADSLAFSTEEAGELLALLGAPVTPEVAADLQARTEGWAVALRLAPAQLAQGMAPEHLIASLADEDGGVAQYLVAEVLANQPAPVRRFLMRVSVTNELWPDLVEQLSPRSNGHRILAALARANAFVERSAGAPGGYRIHALFREMLKAQLAYDFPREVPVLHGICANWYAATGRPRDAIGYAVQAGDWSLAARLVVDNLLVGALLTHEAAPFLRMLDGMPRDFPGPEAAVVRLAAAVAGRRRAGPNDLELARAVAGDPAHRLCLRACAAVSAVSAGADAVPDGRPSAAEAVASEADAAERLLADLPEGLSRQRGELTAAVQAARSFALLHTDAPEDVLRSGLRAALAACSAAQSSRLRSRLLGELALVEALGGQLTEARKLAEEGGALADRRGRTRRERAPAGAAALAWVCMERYLHADARRWITWSKECAPDRESPLVLPLLAILQSRLLRLRHEFDAAEQLLVPHLQKSLPRWIETQVAVEHTRILLAAGSLEAALAVLDAAGDAPWAAVQRATVDVLADRPSSVALPGRDDDLALDLRVEARILLACRHLQAGAESAALTALHGALHLAEPETLRRPFLDSPPQVRRLLRGQSQRSHSADWLNPTSGVTPDRRSEPSAVAPIAEVLQPLSGRELEVLKHLAGLMSTAEIAAAMFVSVNTVRTHIRSILRKLSVSRRNQAVRRGRELGVI